jgi:hypothetical protein
MRKAKLDPLATAAPDQLNTAGAAVFDIKGSRANYWFVGIESPISNGCRRRPTFSTQPTAHWPDRVNPGLFTLPASDVPRPRATF